MESLASLLTGRSQHISLHSSPDTNPSSCSPLQSDEQSSVLLYLSGHGGDGFFKFHDSQELSAEYLAEIIQEMHLRGRFQHMLVVADTCQASTLGRFFPPSVQLLASSSSGENSYADSADPVAAMDRFSLRLAGILLNEATGRSLQEAFPSRLTFSTATLTAKAAPDTAEHEVDWRGSLKQFFSPLAMKSSKLEELEQLQERIQSRVAAGEGLDDDADDDEDDGDSLEEWASLDWGVGQVEDGRPVIGELYWTETHPLLASLLAWGVIFLLTVTMAACLSPCEAS